MDPKLSKLLRPTITKIIRNFLSSIDTSKLKNKKLKEKAQKHIGHITTETLKIIPTITQYAVYIIEKGGNGKKDAIKYIQENEYGGKFTHAQATQIYNSLEKIINIFKKTLKKYDKKNNLSEIKKLDGGGNNKLIDKEGNFTNEMNKVIILSGGTDQKVPVTVPTWDDLKNKASSTLRLLPKILVGFPGLVEPYIGRRSRERKIKSATSHSGPQEGSELQKQVFKFKDIFKGPNADFPSEYDLEFGGHPLVSVFNIAWVSLLTIIMFIPTVSTISYVANGIIFVNALLTKRRFLAVITLVSIFSNLLLGPLSNIFIQGPLYLFYFLDGQRYLDTYNEKIQFKENIKQVHERDLVGTYTIKEGKDGPLVMRTVSKSAKNMKKLDIEHAKLERDLDNLGSGPGDDKKKEEIEGKMKENRVNHGLATAKHNLAKETDYDQLHAHNAKVIDELGKAHAAGLITKEEHDKHVAMAQANQAGLAEHVAIGTAPDNIYFNELYSIYMAYQKSVSIAIHDGKLPIPNNSSNLDSPAQREEFKKKFFTKKGHSIESSPSNPFNLSPATIATLKGTAGKFYIFKKNVAFLNREAVRVSRLIKKRAKETDSDEDYKTSDKILVGVYPNLSPYTIRNIEIQLKLAAILGTYNPPSWGVDVATAKAALAREAAAATKAALVRETAATKAAGGAEGGGGGSILDLYRTAL